MAPPSESDYHLKREVEERALADAAVDPLARRIHFELADRYAERARSATANPPLFCDEKSKEGASP